MPSGLLSREQLPIPPLPVKMKAKPLVPVKVPSDRVKLASGVLPPSPAPPGRPSANRERHGGGPPPCIGEARRHVHETQMEARMRGANQKQRRRPWFLRKIALEPSEHSLEGFWWAMGFQNFVEKQTVRRASCDSEQECGAAKPRFEAPHVGVNRTPSHVTFSRICMYTFQCRT